MPIFHGLVSLPYILNTAQCIDITVLDDVSYLQEIDVSTHQDNMSV